MKTPILIIVPALILSACGASAPESTTASADPPAGVGDATSMAATIPEHHTIVFAGPADERFELFTFSIDDPTPHRLTSQSQELGFPVWSPAGDRIAYVAMSEESADLMVLDTLTGEATVLLPDYFELADWDSQGERLLVGLEAGLHFLNVATGDLQPVETGSTADAYGRCARDADLIAYESGRDGNPEIYVTELDTRKTTRLTENVDLDEWPSPSRDGAWIAWASGTEEDKNLWIMLSDGSEKRQITRDILLGDAFPEWSPDGTGILFTANENDGFVLKLIDVASGEITDLGPGTAPSWR